MSVQFSPTRRTEPALYFSTDQLSKSQRKVQEHDPERDGVKRMKEKYDSLGRIMSEKKNGYTGKNPSTSFRNLKLSDASFNSDANASSHSTSSNATNGVTEHDVLQVEMFHRGHKTEVIVCKCLANLYYGASKPTTEVDQWKFISTGIPLLVLDTGEHHRRKRLRIILAEKGTGFVLWQDVIDMLTKYKAPHSNFHTLHMSTDHTKLAGFSFDETSAATQFYSSIINLTSNPDDDLLNIGRSKKKKKDKVKPKKFKPPKKSDISQPCCFVHVTKLDAPNDRNVDNLSNLVAHSLELRGSRSSDFSDAQSSSDQLVNEYL